MHNEEIAKLLSEAGQRLLEQGANPFRAHAYTKAADAIRALNAPVEESVAESGEHGLQEIPGVGESLARSLSRIVQTGHFALLTRLRGADSPEALLTTISGIGPVLARRLHEELGITSLVELDKAFANGTLARMPGLGEKRIRAIRESLTGRLQDADSPVDRGLSPGTDRSEIGNISESALLSVATILDIDREYREKVAKRSLPRITPKRYNPTKEAWLPVLNTTRAGRYFTALYSNTARAHELGATRDWVVIYESVLKRDASWTVVTSQFGYLRGKRIVRGREDECRDYYRELSLSTANG